MMVGTYEDPEDGHDPAARIGAAGFCRKETWTVKRYQLIGGIILLILAAAIFVFLKSSTSVPAAATLTVAGIALVAVSRRE
jgi:hypothetical protein